MSVTVLTPANTFRLTTLDAVKAEITLEDQLTFAESLIDQASAAVANECWTIFAQQAYREIQGKTYQGQYLFLRYGPIVSVSSVSHGTTVITDYRIESVAGMLYRREGWWLPSYGAEEWQIDFCSGYRLPEQTGEPEPTGPTLREAAPDVERACIECVKVWFHERMVDQRIQSRRLGDQSIDYGVQALRRGIPVLAQELLKPWKRLVIA